jgi:hypothetical protein
MTEVQETSAITMVKAARTTNPPKLGRNGKDDGGKGCRVCLKEGRLVIIFLLRIPLPLRGSSSVPHILFAAFLVLLLGCGVTDGDDDFGRGVAWQVEEMT